MKGKIKVGTQTKKLYTCFFRVTLMSDLSELIMYKVTNRS